MRNRIFSVLASLLIFFNSSCRTTKNGDPIEPVALTPGVTRSVDLSTYTYQSFKVAPVQDRCEGFKSFVSEFVNRELPKDKLDSMTCRFSFFVGRQSNVLTLNLSREAENFTLIVLFQGIQLPYDFKLYTIDGSDEREINTQQPKKQIEADLINFGDALQRWLAADVGQLQFYGQPYGTALQAFIHDYASTDSQKPTVATPVLRLSLDFEAANPNQGKVQFLEVDPVYLRPRSGLMGCKDLACLNDGQTQFFIADNALRLFRPLPSNPKTGPMLELEIGEQGAKTLQKY